MAANVTPAAILTLSLDRSRAMPLNEQLYGQIRELILTGRLSPGTQLPSSRALMADLGVSRTTILQAFDQLGSEGYIEGRHGSGTYVPKVLPDSLLVTRTADAPCRPRRQRAAQLSTFASGAVTESGLRATRVRAFHPGLPETDLFPFDLWARLMARHWRRPHSELLSAPAPAGYTPLRRAIADHLRSLRGLDCRPEQIIITSSAHEAVTLVSRTLLNHGDAVWVENPGYPAVRQALDTIGIRAEPIPVDDEGLSVADGRDLDPGARMAVVTPSRQYPLGVTMSLARRLSLLEWARDAQAWILEDDYDSEYRYAGRPISSLQSLDDRGRVIYLGSFSKVLFRKLRIGYIAVPEDLVAPMLKVRLALADEPSVAAQPALADFISSGQFAVHIRRMRRLYAERQEAMLTALDRHADGILTAERQDAGMHLVARLAPALARRMRDHEAQARAAEAGVVAVALSSFYQGELRSEGLLLGYAGVPEVEIDSAMRRLVAALKG